MNAWSLPKTARIGGVTYSINTDFRDILEIIGHLNDGELPEILRWRIAVGLFYEGEIPEKDLSAAMEFLGAFISYGQPSGKVGPKLMDWEQDAQIIIGDINKVAGMEVRAVSYLHWWTFLSYFYGIGEGQLSSIVSIREKRAKGKRLEKWEQEFYRDNKDRVDFKAPEKPEDKEIQDYFAKWL